MKTKISLITLIACAAAGTLDATAATYKQSSGSETNSGTLRLVPDSWVLPELGFDTRREQALLKSAYESVGEQYTWNAARTMYLTGESRFTTTNNGKTEIEIYRKYEATELLMSLSGNASYTNNGTMIFAGGVGQEVPAHYEEEKETTSGNTTTYECDELQNNSAILLSGTSSFTNAGTMNPDNDKAIYQIWALENANFVNTGTIEDFEIMVGGNATMTNKGSLTGTDVFLFGGAKLVNAAAGELGDACIDLCGNAVLENAGALGGDWAEICLIENAKIVNTGTFASSYIEFDFEKGYRAGTATFENWGAMTGARLEFGVYADSSGSAPTNISASFENYGEIVCDGSMSYYGAVRAEFDLDSDCATADVYKAAIRKSDLNFKNFGVIDVSGLSDPRVEISSAVKLTLAEGSQIKGNLSIGRGIEYYGYDSATQKSYASVFRMNKDELNIVLTGSGGNEPLISGGLEVCSLVELNVSFAEDAVKKTKYVLTVWGGELTVNGTQEIYDPYDGSPITATHDAGFIESSLSGTLARFGTTYEWVLNTATGVLTAKDVNIGEEVDVTSGSQNVTLGAKDVATFSASLSEYSSSLAGSGEVHSEADLTFTGDAGSLTGTLSVDAGTMTVTAGANLGSSATLDVAGTLALEGTRTVANATRGNGAIELSSGADVTFSKSVGVKTLNVNAGATLSGGVSLTHGADSTLNLAGTLVLDADAGEKVSLGGGKVVLAGTAALDLYGNGGGLAAGTYSTRTFAATSPISALANGERVTIFEGGSLVGDVENFLRSDAEMSSLASNYVVLYDASNGLTVQALTNPEALSGGVNTSDLSASFVAWALGGLTDELAALPVGFTDAATLGALGGGGDPLMNALLSGDAGTARSILDRLSPKSYAAMIAMPVETFHDDARNVSARLAQRRFDRFSEKAPWEFFAQAQTISVDNDTATDAPTFDFDRYGVFAGADYRFDETTTFGVAVGAGTGEAKIHAGGGKIESDDYRLTVFGGKTLGETGYVNAGAQLGFASYDVKRTTDYGNASASADGWNAGVFAETGVRLTLSESRKLYVTPYVGLAYTHAATDSFTESGNERAAFAADSLSGDSLRARVGCAFSWGFDVAGARWRVGLDAAYSRELLDDEIDVDVTAKDGTRISEKAKALPENVFSIGPTVNVDVSPSASVYAGYSFNAGTDSSTTHSANVGFRMRF